MVVFFLKYIEAEGPCNSTLRRYHPRRPSWEYVVCPRQVFEYLKQRAYRIPKDGRRNCEGSDTQGWTAHPLLPLPMGMGTYFLGPIRSLATN